MTTQVYLVRHCQAEGNIYRRVHGVYDSRVTPLGLRQIDALAERFRDVPVDAVYSSDLQRTRTTAGAILRHHDLPLLIEPRLREMDAGTWEDRPFGDVALESPELMRRFNDDPAAWHVPGAETYEGVQRRMKAAVEEIAARHAGGAAVCVSHGMAIRDLLALYLGLSSREIHELPHGDNTAVSLLEFGDDGAVRVVYVNDASHLPERLSTFARQTWWKDTSRPDPGNIHFRRLDPRKYPGVYTEFYEKTWRAVHGSTEGFLPSLYVSSAIRHVQRCPDALVTIHRPDGQCVGITELDPERGADEGYGWICLCFVEEDCRRSLLGVQLIGHAVSVFRAMGRKSIRLTVFEGNEGARRFYEAYEFRPIGETEGVSGKLIVMEKEI